MSYYKKSNLERQSFSGVKMDRGSLIYKILHLQIANELLISVPCYKTAKTWNIMYSHNIIKRFWESGEISACEAETQCETPVISGPSGSTALKKKKSSIMQRRKRKSQVWSSNDNPERPGFSGPKLIKNRVRKSGKLFCCQRTHFLNSLWKIWSKKERDHLAC